MSCCTSLRLLSRLLPMYTSMRLASLPSPASDAISLSSSESCARGRVRVRGRVRARARVGDLVVLERELRQG